MEVWGAAGEAAMPGQERGTAGLGAGGPGLGLHAVFPSCQTTGGRRGVGAMQKEGSVCPSNGDAVLWVRLPRAPTNPTISPSRAMGTDRRRSVPAALGGCQSLLGKERGKSCSPSRNGRSSQQKPPAIPNVWGDPNGNVGWWGWGVTQ